MLSADCPEEFVEARRLDAALLADNPRDPEEELTSDHFPVFALF